MGSERGPENFSDGETEEGLIYLIITGVFSSPLNIVLLCICIVLIYKIYRTSGNTTAPFVAPVIMKLKKKDMTLDELKLFDGTGEEGRVCVAVNGKIFDVTKGKKFYGPGGPYSDFAGKDATRALATFSVKDAKGEYDDLSDLSSTQMESVREWEMQFMEKYEYIGKLLRPGEQPTEYSDDEEVKETEEHCIKED